MSFFTPILSSSSRCISRCGLRIRPQLILSSPRTTPMTFTCLQPRPTRQYSPKPAKKASTPVTPDKFTKKGRASTEVDPAEKAALLLELLRTARKRPSAAPAARKRRREPVVKVVSAPTASQESGSPEQLTQVKPRAQDELPDDEVTLTIDEKEEAIQRRIAVMRRKLLRPGIWTLLALAGTYGALAYMDVRAGIPSSDGSQLPERAQLPQTWYLTPTVVLDGAKAFWKELDNLTIGIVVATFAIHLLKRSPLPIWERLIHVTGEAKWTAFTYPLVNSSWLHAAQNMAALAWFLPGVVHYFDGDIYHTSAFLISVPLITSYVTHFAYRFNLATGLVLNVGASGAIAAAFGLYSVVYAHEKLWVPPGFVLRFDAMYWGLIFAASEAYLSIKSPKGGNRPASLVHLASMGLGAAYAYFDLKHHLWIPLVSEISSTQSTDPMP